MALRLKNNCEFLHVPKTGGTWVRQVLEENDLVEKCFGHEHSDFERTILFDRLGTGRELLRQSCKMAIGKYVTLRPGPKPIRFCFVRHPLRWIESWWKYMQGCEWRDWGVEGDYGTNWHPCAVLNGLGDSDFNIFVYSLLNKCPGFVSELYASFAKPGIDFVGRTERLSQDLDRVIKMCGLDLEASSLSRPRSNVSKGSRDAVVWDPRLKQMAMHLELPALVRFGYLTEADCEEFKIPFALLAAAGSAR